MMGQSMELINTHNHTTYCGHAESSMEDMVDAALAKGIATFAITEHYPMIEPYDDCGYISMLYSREDAYCQEVRDLRAAHPEMEIILGTEVDWLGDSENRDLASEDWNRFELILGSVHFIDGWGFDDPAYRDRWDEMGVDEVWRRYFEIWCEAATSKMPFHVMAHPDLVKKFGYRPSFDPHFLYAVAAEAAASAGRMVEVNTAGAYNPCAEFYPAPDFLREFCRAGVPCTIGTDAHAARDVARGLKEAYRYLYDAGYRVITVPTSDGDRREVRLD